MSNTLIQIKRSLTTAVPPNGSLAAGEQAYSYSSNTLFVGTPDGAGVIAIGGKYYIDVLAAAYAQANAAYNTANTGLSVSAAFGAANAAFGAANAAYGQANSTDAIAIAGITAANASFAAANAAYAATNASFNTANTARTVADAAFNTANGAYGVANNALPKAGGTISGDLAITGNIVVSGTTTYANTQTLLIGDNIFVVNADLPNDVAPSEDAGFTVNRGSSAEASVLWLESVDKWAINDGTGYEYIASNTDIEIVDAKAVAAFLSANSGYGAANAAFAKANSASTDASAAFLAANSAYGTANTARTVADAAFVAANASFTFANSAHTVANAAFVHANSAYAQANAASAQAANADFLTTGTVSSARITGSYTGITGVGTISTGTWQGSTIAVGYGGTGQTSFTTNGMLYGNGSGALNVTAAGTEGQVLQASATGVPQFGMLDGGSF